MGLIKTFTRAILGLALVTVGGQVFAAEEPIPAHLAKQKISFSYSGFRSAYSCSYAEGQTLKVLKSLGAQKAKVRCSGGLEMRQNYVHVTAQFLALREASAEKSTHVAYAKPVTIKFDESCDLHDMIIKNMLKGFEVYSMDRDNRCYNWQGRVRYDVLLLKQ